MRPEGLATEQTSCQHHWVLETAAGPTSKGVCQRCGTEKEFKNTIETDPWTYGRPARPDSDTEG